METPFPPFEPEEKIVRPQPRLRDIPFRTLFPNILTLLAICSGLTSIRFAMEGRMELAIAAIILAAFLDAIDGRVARFLKSTTRFGEQMDSLADFVNFGVAPAMLLYILFLQGLKPLGWIAALIFAVCSCLRLARFNAQLDMANRPNWQNDYFVGVPAPAGAMVALLPVYIYLLGLPKSDYFSLFVAIFTVIVGLLMVSNIPTFSGKNIGQRIPRDVAMPLILIFVILVAVLLSYPWGTLIVASVTYLVFIPFSFSQYKKLAAIELADKTKTEAGKIASTDASVASTTNADKPKRVRAKKSTGKAKQGKGK